MENQTRDTKTAPRDPSDRGVPLADYDICIIGGGINGCGLARDAAGRGYSVYLCEQGDLASGTSSASTKLIHGGLRYLEHLEFRLVREALAEREVLLSIAPHMIYPLRFVLPVQKKTGIRPAWLLRLGLWLYDHIGGKSSLPGTRRVDLKQDVVGSPLKAAIRRNSIGLEYSDCWVDDARLVVLNALDAREHGAHIETRTRFIEARRFSHNSLWNITVQHVESGQRNHISASLIVNATGPWADQVLRTATTTTEEQKAQQNNLRLVQGSHIIVNKLFDHDKCYLLQNSDQRIVFVIPYQDQFTLIGTTDRDYAGDPADCQISETEIDYLCAACNAYFEQQISSKEIIDSYSGVRALHNDGSARAQETTRDYVLRVDRASIEGVTLPDSAPLVNLFGGKITTYRRLAESALKTIDALLNRTTRPWTANTPLPGGNFTDSNFSTLLQQLESDYPFLNRAELIRMARRHGSLTRNVLGVAKCTADLGLVFGRDSGHALYQREIEYLVKREWALTLDDILYRRTKSGLHFSQQDREALKYWLDARLPLDSAE